MKQTLHDLLRKGKTLQTLEILQTLTLYDNDLSKEVILLLNRFARIERQRHRYSRDNSELEVQFNRINDAILSVIDELDESRIKPIEFEQLLTKNNDTPQVDINATKQLTSSSSFWKKWATIGGALVFAIGIAANVAQISGFSLKDFMPGKEDVKESSSIKAFILIKGLIKDDVGDVLKNVRIVIDDKSTTTDDNGYFELIVKVHDDQTNYHVNISKIGFITQNETYIPNSQIPEFRLHKK